MVRQARAEQTRNAIVRAAADMFDRFGYGSTSLSDIIAQAGVTKGALYFHFSSKEDLAYAVVQEQHALWMERAHSLAQPDAPALETLIRLSYQLATELREHPVIRGGIRLTLEQGTFQRPLPDPYRDWIDLTTVLLERATGELAIKSSLPLDRVARFIVSTFTGLQLVAQVLEERRDLLDRVADMWHLLLPGLVLARKQNYYLGFVTTAKREQLDA